MNHLQLVAAAAAIVFVDIYPCNAQTSEAPKPAASVPTGSLQRVDNDWPARTLIGSSVFNENGQRVATIRELLITDDGKVDRVVLALSRPSKLVVVAFSQLQFVPSQRFDVPVLAVRGRTSRMVSAAHADRRPYGVMLPGVTPGSLAHMENFHLAP
jgi:PRC-barrel domain